MGDNTARANLYLPGGGSSGLITPPEQVDIDKINDNMRKVDNLLGAAPFTSTTRPTGPMDGQLIYETDTGNTLIYRLSETAWRPVGVPNCPSEAYRNAIFPATPIAGSECYRADKNWTERWHTAAQIDVGGEGWYPITGALPSILMSAKNGFTPPVGQTWGTPASLWDIKLQGGMLYSPPGETEMLKCPVAGEYEFTWHISSYGTSGGSGKLFALYKGTIPNSDLSGNALLLMEDEIPSVGTNRRWMTGSITHNLLKDDIFRWIFIANGAAHTFSHASPYRTNRLMVRYVRPPLKTI